MDFGQDRLEGGLTGEPAANIWTTWMPLAYA